jgi:hypothetical protein
MDRRLEGMLIIAKYEPKSRLAVGHDQIWFGNYETRERMTEAEQARMAELGWSEHEDAWHCYV